MVGSSAEKVNKKEQIKKVGSKVYHIFKPTQEKKVFKKTAIQLNRYKKIILQLTEQKDSVHITDSKESEENHSIAIDIKGPEVTKQTNQLFESFINAFRTKFSAINPEPEEGQDPEMGSEAHLHTIASQESKVKESEEEVKKLTNENSAAQRKLKSQQKLLNAIKQNPRAKRVGMKMHERWKQFKNWCGEQWQRFKKFIKGVEVKFTPILQEKDCAFLKKVGEAVLKTLDQEIKEQITELKVKCGLFGGVEVEIQPKKSEEGNAEQKAANENKPEQRKFSVKILPDGKLKVKEKKSFAERAKEEKAKNNDIKRSK